MGCTRSTIPKATPSLCTKPVALYSKIKRSKFSVLYTRRKVCKSFCVLLLLKEGSYLLSHILYIGIIAVSEFNLICVTEVSQTLFHLVLGFCCAIAPIAEVQPIVRCRAVCADSQVKPLYTQRRGERG